MVDGRLKDHSEPADSLHNTEHAGFSHHICHPFIPVLHPNIYHAESGEEVSRGSTKSVLYLAHRSI